MAHGHVVRHGEPHLALDVAGLTLRTAGDLVDHDVRVRQRVAFAFRAGAEEHRAHAGGDAHAIRRHVARHELHRVVDREAGRHGAAGRVDVDVDVLLRVLHLEEKHLRDHDVRDLVVDRRADEDDAILEETRIDIVTALAAPGLLDNDGNQHGMDF